MGELNLRRKSLDPNKLHRNSDGNFRIHIQSTKAICRNRSLIGTTDSLKLYEDQMIFKNPILTEVDEASLQKRPLSLCFDLGSSGEEINATDTSSTISSVSSSSSSSTNSKSGCSSSSKWDYEPFLEEDVYKGNKSNSLLEDFNIDSDKDSFISADSSAKESIITVINKRCSGAHLSESPKNCANSISNCDCENCSVKSNDSVPNRKLLVEQSYDLNSPDDFDFNKICVSDNEVTNNNHNNNKIMDSDIPAKEIGEIIKIFNLNSVGMRMFEDSTRSLVCMVKIFINLSEPVRMGSPTHLPNASLVSDKTLFPRGGFELVNIVRSTTCKEIIEHLFEKFHIQENYCNYALFEHTMKQSEKDYLKRLGYDFSILGHLINMVRIEKQNFTVHFQCKRFVLQENEKAPINWSSFSVSELTNFLRILEKEENERREKIIDFYSELGDMIERQMKLSHE